PAVQVLTPVAAQKTLVGSLTVISWQTTGDALVSQTVQLSLDGGATWQDVAVGLPASPRAYSWRVPDPPTQTARVRVLAYDRSGAMGEAMNPGNFSIVNKVKAQKKTGKL